MELRPKRNVSYRDTFLTSPEPRQRQRFVLQGEFRAERVIAMKETTEKLYLVKWLGYSDEESSWEPEIHLNDALLQSFTAPLPISDVLRDHIVQMISLALEQSLKSPLKSTLSLPCDHRVISSIFQIEPQPINKAVALSEQHFQRAGLLGFVERTVSYAGHRRRIDFPVNLKLLLSRSPKFPGAPHSDRRRYVTKFRLEFTKTSFLA